MDISKFANRHFQLWEYRVSHGSLLIRSPQSEERKSNIDIIFAGVEYLEMPRFIRDISFAMPLTDEISRVENILGKKIHPADLCIQTHGDHPVFLRVRNPAG
jgi:hypothetical protein